MIKKFNEMEQFNFSKVEDSKANKLYLFIMFMGGDADTQHPIYHEFKNIKFSEYKNHLDEINKVIDDYKILKNILNVDHRLCSRRKVEEKYGKEIAYLYDNTPFDPQTDYDTKCYLDHLELIGYDENGNKHRSYIK